MGKVCFPGPYAVGRMSAVPNLPVPDLELAERVSSRADPAAAGERYIEYGRQIRDSIEALLPTEWSWDGRRVLDFGCGAGRVLRHLIDTGAELHGCDIDRPSIEWLKRHMSPPAHFSCNSEQPGLDFTSDSFDLVYAISVFTHLADDWSAWLLELRRILKPDGLLVATFLGEGMTRAVTGEDWDETRFGMNVLNHGQSWNLGGPTVLHSPWWIHEHWGRAFEILELMPTGFASAPGGGHGAVLMRPRPGEPTTAELEAIDSGDDRELSALRHNIHQLHRENEHARHWLAELEASRSWRMTAPFRAIRR